MIHLFQEVFYRPILNLLVLLFNIIPGNDLGIAIILLTVIIKMILYPLSQKSIQSQKALQDLQPKIEEVKKKYKDNKEEQSKAMLSLYKENKVNPFSSCFPLLVQLPFLIAIFQVFKDGLGEKSLSLTYSFITRPDFINTVFLGINLSKPNIILAILAGLAQFWQAKMMLTKRPEIKAEGSKDEDLSAIMNKQMIYFAPIFTVFIGMSMPGGLSLYWFISTLMTALQQLYILKYKNTKGKDIPDSGVTVQ